MTSYHNDLNIRAAEYKRSDLAQRLFNWISNDELTYNSVQRIVTDAYLCEGRDIDAAGSALKTWLELEIDGYKTDALRDWSHVYRKFQDARASVYGLISEMLEWAFSSMNEADWQGLAADLLQEPYTTQIHSMAGKNQKISCYVCGQEATFYRRGEGLHFCNTHRAPGDIPFLQ